ncbi:GNAT family N-acetyltransferase [Leptospira sp. GIMC2001]|uniref:GNAT family N-acetyltransferase n=1 Tax=Leptospira sp. GIMC2001 TaxID=1513297 RepID=UPI00234AF8B3|nr:GNAT family N-acetyltransferase [Leptospira sp. GIMC2001]WCL50810.1 GNAT family N-acetyltransferase [Leptospira sp. GIMC2001]
MIDSQIIIRKAVTDDIQGVYDLVELFSTTFKVDFECFKVTYSENIIDEKSIILVAMLDKKIIGYCLGFFHSTFYANGKVAILEEIMVMEKFRRKKVGEMLMRDFENWAKSNNISIIGLATRRAAFFYEALNYENSALYFRKLI